MQNTRKTKSAKLPNFLSKTREQIRTFVIVCNAGGKVADEEI